MTDAKALLKDVVKLWSKLGWQDYDDASLIASRIIFENRLTAKALTELPPAFFTFNRVSRGKVLQALSQLKPVSGVANTPSHVNILLLTASPDFTGTHIRVDKEHRDIIKRIRASTNRDSMIFHALPATRPVEVIDEINRIKPTILQISSHGEVDGIVLEGESIYDAALSASRLNRILATASSHLKIVVLNSCHSYKQAEALVQHVDVAIGMSQAIGDKAALAFSGQFYSSLGEGVSIQTAFDQALINVDIISPNYADTPKLYAAKGIDTRTYTVC